MTTVSLQAEGSWGSESFEGVEHMRLNSPRSVILKCDRRKLKFDNVVTVSFPDARKYVDVVIRLDGTVEMFFYDFIVGVVSDGTEITAITRPTGGSAGQIVR